MAGLDTRGAFDGFVQGFGLMQNYQDGKDRKAYLQQQQGMQERGLQMREQEFAAQQDDRQNQRDQQQIAQFYTGWASGMDVPVTPDLAQAFERNKMMDPRHLFRPEVEAAVQYADKLAKGEGSLFSQQTVDAMNDFYAPRVNRGSGGKKRLAGMYPGQQEGTFVFELEVEDEQGNKRLAPMTVNRGIAGEDDEVAQYEIGQAIGPVMGAKSLYQALGQNREKMLGYLRSSGYLPKEAEKWERVEGPDGAILQRNIATGEMKSVVGRKSAGAGGAYAPSSDVKTLEYLKANGMSDQEARDELVRLKRGGGDGSISAGDRYRVTFLTNQIKEIDSQLEAFPDPEAETALRQQREQLVQARQALASDLGLTGAPAQQPAQAGSESSGNFDPDAWLDAVSAATAPRQQSGSSLQMPGERGENEGLGLSAEGLSYRPPAESVVADVGKRYQLRGADAILPLEAREAIASVPGRVAAGAGTLAAKANAQALFRKTLNRSPSAEELATLLDMGRGEDGNWSAPHWRALRERFGG
ncbi:hypothetical protein ACYCFK_17905 [Stutzerimonas stutzeri]